MLRNWLGDWVGTFLGKPRLPGFLSLKGHLAKHGLSIDCRTQRGCLE